jgi:hypothetical protein
VKIWTMGLALLWTGCAPADTSGDAEVAAELRALRQSLVAAGRDPARASPGSGAEIAAALTPLREALAGLVANQRELQQQQLALTQELQRWSGLLVAQTGGAGRDDWQALTHRLQQLEAAIDTQAARQREAETLLRDALERTADHLERFLDRVGVPVDSPPGDAPPPSGTPAVPPDRAAETPAGGGPVDGGRTGQWAPGNRGSLWWGGAVAVGLLCGVICLRRWRRAGVPGVRRVDEVAPTPGVGGADVQEIWAAAALLGEAVGRLREAQAGDAGGVAVTEPMVVDEEPIVLDDELLRPVGADVATAAPPGPAATRSEPIAASCRLPAEDPVRSMQVVLQILQQDPRVLRRPEPAVRCARDGLEVSFRLVPELPPGDRSHLEQRLRDACASTGA